jgi:hypothetical protein
MTSPSDRGRRFRLLYPGFILLAVLVDSGCSDQAYYLAKEHLSTTLPVLPDTSIAYQANIQRIFWTPEEERLLCIAEATYPSRTAVLKGIQSAPFRVHPVPSVPHLWWTSMFTGIRIPFAVTKAAVLYYARLTESFRRRDFGSAGTPVVSSSTFRYTATIRRDSTYANAGERFENVYVVQMLLHWEGGWLEFSKDRVVVLRPNGKVLAVFGDGNASSIVQ